MSAFRVRQVGAYMYMNNGPSVCGYDSYNHGSFHYAFGATSWVTFQLDLRPDQPENGTLTSSVTAGPTVTLFRQLRSQLVEGAGFVPVVSLIPPGRVRLVEIVKLRS